MKGDFSRSTFRPGRHYHGVLMQQGRVQLDADWNEQAEIHSHLDERTRLDVIGACGAPRKASGFAIEALGTTDLAISAGRIYVDGILSENGSPAIRAELVDGGTVVLGSLLAGEAAIGERQWIELFDASDAAGPHHRARITALDPPARRATFTPALTAADLASLTAATAAPAAARVYSYTTQPDLPGPAFVASGAADAPHLATDDGAYLAYLDVWLRHETALDDPTLPEPALGGPDTATRARTVAQVRLRRLEGPWAPECPGLEPERPPSTGRLAARAQPGPASADACHIPPGAGYQGLENQLYRVEVHEPGELGAATFKWSRDNAAFAASWVDQQVANQIVVSDIGPDSVIRFDGGQVVEVLDDTLELQGLPGTLTVITAPPVERILTVDPPVARTAFPRNPKVRRWDCAAAAPVEVAADNEGFLKLENGVEIRFEAGWYNTGDYWLIPARAGVTQGVLWPLDAGGTSCSLPPAGIVHHYCPLDLVRIEGNAAVEVVDCRSPFASLTELCAEDICFDNDGCRIPGADTVQDALDALCEESNLRRHKKHLHGWGVVCGLEVVCGRGQTDDSTGRRRHVTVQTGYAVDCEGNDVILHEPHPIDFLSLIEKAGADAGLLDGHGDGDVCLILDNRDGLSWALEKHDPNWDKAAGLLAGTLLMDVYNDCVRHIEDFLREELGSGESQHGRGQRAVLASLLAQVLNPGSGQLIYISEREDKLIREFYARLRDLLRSQTFCAMFDGAHPFPDYPKLPAMDTIFARGHHHRIRLRSGKSAEAYTVGGGINPVKPSGFINRYSVGKGLLTQRLDPIAGTVGEHAKPDAGAGAVQDVAFSPDGNRIYMVAPTRNGENTLFRAGRITASGVSWGELVTICDVQLVTLATTKADPKSVYAAGRGKGVYRIDPDAVDPSMPPTWAFAASGHLVLTAEGRGYATAAQSGASVGAGRYDSFVRFGVKDTAQTSVMLPQAGEDDLAVFEARANQPTRVYAVVGTGSEKGLAVYDGDGKPVGGAARPSTIPLPSSAIRLAPFAPTGVLLVVSEDDCIVAIFDVARSELVEEAAVPVQVGPVSVASDATRRFAYVLNYWSDTITVIPGEMLTTKVRFPFGDLARYRREILLAFRDLLAGFLQYLKDCFCDHLLVQCPTCDEGDKLYLGCVSIRGGSVQKVCNFTRRRYVKSFPTIGYWASLVPVLPFAGKLVEEFCCMVLPDLFGRYQPPQVDPAQGRPSTKYRYSSGRTKLEQVQGSDLPWKFQQVRSKALIGGALAGKSLWSGLTSSHADHATAVGKLVGQPLENAERILGDRGAQVVAVPELPQLGQLLGSFAGFLRTPRAGDRVAVHETEGRVRFYSVSPQGADVGEQVRVLTETLRAKDTEMAGLLDEVRALRSAHDELLSAVGPETVAGMAREIEELRRFREEARTVLNAIKPPEPPRVRSDTDPPVTPEGGGT